MIFCIVVFFFFILIMGSVWTHRHACSALAQDRERKGETISVTTEQMKGEDEKKKIFAENKNTSKTKTRHTENNLYEKTYETSNNKIKAGKNRSITLYEIVFKSLYISHDL